MSAGVLTASAQQDSTKLRKEVEVVKTFTPTIQDAYKINENPSIAQPETTKPVFDYQIKTRPMFTTFETEPVQAATMRPAPLEKLGAGMLKLGAGNYLSQYGEFFYNTRAGRSGTVGLHLKSHLTNGKLKLMNDDKVKAPHNDNLAELFTSHNLGGSVLTTRLYYERESFRYYGYTGNYLNDAEKADSVPGWNTRQAFPKAGIALQFDKKYDPKHTINYSTGINYQYFGSQTGQREHAVKWNGRFTAPILLMDGVFDAGISYNNTDSVYSYYTNRIEKRDQLIIKVAPAAVFDAEELKFKIGVNTFTTFDRDRKANYFLSPSAGIEFMPVKNWLSLYAGIDGYVVENNYSKIAEENPFVRYDQNLRNTKYRYVLTGGIKGKMTGNLNYSLQADYANIKDQYFFYLNRIETIESGTVHRLRENTFDIAYDHVKQLTLAGELHYAMSQELDIRLNARLNTYTTDSLEHAYLKPAFEAGASLNYDPDGPFRFTADAYLTGPRKALTRVTHNNTDVGSWVPVYTSENTTLPAIIDLNLGVEYQFNKNLTFWGRSNNFSFKKYELFPGYAQQGFNFLMGASLTF